MLETPPSVVPRPDLYKQWKPEAQERALDLLRQAESQPWRPFYCHNPGCNGQPHVWPDDTRDCPHPYGHEWVEDTIWFCNYCKVTGQPLDEWLHPHARADQRPPRWLDDWLYWWLSGGRGSGKTRTGSEITNRVTTMTPRIILIAPTGPDLRETMVEGRSGLLRTANPKNRPIWEPSKKKLTWPNGCIAQGFSAEEPDRLRGPESGFIWADEPAHYPDPEAVWDNMLFGFRVKPYPAAKKRFAPRIVATSTPKPTKWVKKQLEDALSIVHRVSSYANIANLDDVYRKVIIPKYEGTRTGKQELYGELLEDVEGALWNWDMIQWIEEAPELQRIVVAVDPAGTANKRSDETGIVVLGITRAGNIYVLHDASGKYSPEGWASRVNGLVEEFSADAIVVEKNYGEDMVTFTLENSGYKGARIIGVRSRRGKELRAEPIVALYEKKRVFHVGRRGDLLELEEEQTTWVPHEGPSPNRVDALVHGATELARVSAPASVASPNEILRNRRAPTNRHLRAV